MLNDRFCEPIFICRVNYLRWTNSSLLHLPYTIGSKRLLYFNCSGNSIHDSRKEYHEYFISILHIVSPDCFKHTLKQFCIFSSKDKKLLVWIGLPIFRSQNFSMSVWLWCSFNSFLVHIFNPTVWNQANIFIWSVYKPLL